MDFTKEDINLINKEFEELKLMSLKRIASQKEFDVVLKAFEFANQAHKGSRRRSGEPYILHPICVAKIVVSEIGLGYKSIAAALLHDVVEDTEYTVEDISRLFGEKIASLVDGLTKIKAAMDNDGGTLQAENFKRIILTLNDDVRVVLIKLADRLHNIRTIDSMPEYKKDKILSETMYLFVPLAHRLGLYNIKSEMENIWFKTRYPETYSEIVAKTDALIKEKGEAMENFIEPISKALTDAGYEFVILRRTKSPYSIWHKIEHKHVIFEDIYDICGTRIIFKPKADLDERAQCWHIYSLVTGIYTPKPDRLRDWVTRPKSNGYEALHCTVMSNGGGWVEVQIRSERMNAVAEKGIAAHWNYKDHGDKNSEKEMEHWLDMVRDVLENPDANALEFLDQFHDSLLSKEIYVFTPKGESKSLPKGATALDFAYCIHSQIGNRAIAAKVNLKLVPLSKVLQNGDQVEIITANSQKPQAQWLDFLKTPKARNYVYEYLKEEINDSIRKGREILDNELAKLGVKVHRNVLNKLLKEYNVKTKEELYNKISTGLISLKDLDKVLRKNNQNKNVIYWTLKLFKNNNNSSSDNDANAPEEEITNEQIYTELIKNQLGKNRDFIINGNKNLTGGSITYRVADCCYPIPGDAIVGFINDNHEVVVHKKSCPNAINLASVQGDRIVNAKWSKNTVESFLARIQILGMDRIGILNELTKITTLMLNINIRKISVASHDNIFEGFIDCYVKSTEDLNILLEHIRKIKGIENVKRIDIKDEQ